MNCYFLGTNIVPECMKLISLRVLWSGKAPQNRSNNGADGLSNNKHDVHSNLALKWWYMDESKRGFHSPFLHYDRGRRIWTVSCSLCLWPHEDSTSPDIELAHTRWEAACAEWDTKDDWCFQSHVTSCLETELVFQTLWFTSEGCTDSHCDESTSLLPPQSQRDFWRVTPQLLIKKLESTAEPSQTCSFLSVTHQLSRTFSLLKQFFPI